MATFWETWTNPDTDEIAELIAFEQWIETKRKLPSGWNKYIPANWNNDLYVEWTTLGITKTAKNYPEAKIKTELMNEAKLLAKSIGKWTGKKANETTPIKLFIDNIDRTGYFTGTRTFTVGSPGVTHTVIIEKGLIKEWNVA